MEYQRKHQQLILRLNRGEELLSAVRAVCKEEKILSASVVGLGAADYVKLGVYSVARKEYIVRELSGEREIAALTGNVTAKDGAALSSFSHRGLRGRRRCLRRASERGGDFRDGGICISRCMRSFPNACRKRRRG